MLQRLIIPIAFLLVILNACSEGREKQLQKQEDVIKFNKIFTNSFHQSGFLGGIGGGQSSISSSILFGRYVVKLQFKIEDIGGKYTKASEAQLSVWEYRDHINDGTPIPLSRVIIGTLNEDEWDSISSFEDLFRFIDVNPIENSPFSELATRPPESW